jgi:hypothetical protein
MPGKQQQVISDLQHRKSSLVNGRGEKFLNKPLFDMVNKRKKLLLYKFLSGALFERTI